MNTSQLERAERSGTGPIERNADPLSLPPNDLTGQTEALGQHNQRKVFRDTVRVT